MAKKGNGCLKFAGFGCLGMIAFLISVLVGTIIFLPPQTKPLESTITYDPSVSTSTPSSSPLKDTNSSTTYYLAVNADVPAPENPVPVADYETMQALVSAAESKDEAKYNSLLQSPSVSLVYGGGIVFIQDRKDGLVKVEIMGKSVNGDISGQTRWTSDRFIQSREF